MDKLLRGYITHVRISKRPLALLFNIVDLTALADYIRHTANNDMVSHKADNRELLLQELGETLSLQQFKIDRKMYRQ